MISLNSHDPNVKPDLLLIDGGRNQLNFVQMALSKTNHKNINTLSIVKGVNRMRASETILSNKGILELDKNSKAFLLLQEIRDESHRFAIQAQRKKIRKFVTKSELDNVDGIGKILKARLLKKFKSIKNIKTAPKNELMTVKGINEKIISNIKKNI